MIQPRFLKKPSLLEMLWMSLVHRVWIMPEWLEQQIVYLYQQVGLHYHDSKNLVSSNYWMVSACFVLNYITFITKGIKVDNAIQQIVLTSLHTQMFFLLERRSPCGIQIWHCEHKTVEETSKTTYVPVISSSTFREFYDIKKYPHKLNGVFIDILS